MLCAYRKFNEISDIPLHIGVTESGTLKGGTVKSAVGIGALLAEGIGDTMRVSLRQILLKKFMRRMIFKRFWV